MVLSVCEHDVEYVMKKRVSRIYIEYSDFVNSTMQEYKRYSDIFGLENTVLIRIPYMMMKNTNILHDDTRIGYKPIS